MLRINRYLQEMQTLLRHISTAMENFRQVTTELQYLGRKYQKAEINYQTYSKKLRKILSNKTRTHVVEAYNKYVHSLKHKLKELNLKVLKIIYKDTSYDNLSLGKKYATAVAHHLPPLDALEIGQLEIHAEIKEIGKRSKKELAVPRPDMPEVLHPPQPVKLGFIRRLVYAFQAKEKPWLDRMEQSDAVFGGIFSIDFLRYLLAGKEKEMFGDTSVIPSILTYADKMGEDDFGILKADVLDPYLLEKQIKELKNLISKKKPEIYKASTLGYLANRTVRSLSIFFMEHYPDLFKSLYKAIRYSNIKILANTYINIIFFLTTIISLISLPVLFTFFIIQGNPFTGVLLRTFLGFIIAINVTFWSGYYYPFMRAKSRRRSINTNLPFAIDHMSSVIASGVSPSTMFKLISNSREYGEISIEIEKVTNYIDFFGYDILTALKAVALTTPSEDFKEFISGFVSTIETGGDLKSYLAQKSSEALLNYRLERQKYVESLATYSDIYTGVLIAAPLFFVTVLSLISVLGGSIGGMSINSIITVGTYLVIPALNLVFLVFLEVNQPEI